MPRDVSRETIFSGAAHYPRAAMFHETFLRKSACASPPLTQSTPSPPDGGDDLPIEPLIPRILWSWSGFNVVLQALPGASKTTRAAGVGPARRSPASRSSS
jgi:hypothetical protein